MYFYFHVQALRQLHIFSIYSPSHKLNSSILVMSDITITKNIGKNGGIHGL